MADEIFGKNEAEIEAEIARRLQLVAKEAVSAATVWVDGWHSDKVSIKRKIVAALNAKLEEILMRALTNDVITLAQNHVRTTLMNKYTDEYIRTHPEYERALRLAESEFWRDFSYKMNDAARKAGSAAAQTASHAYEKSMTTLIKRSVLDHFAASDGLAQLEAEAKAEEK